jgi:TolB-like protein
VVCIFDRTEELVLKTPEGNTNTESLAVPKSSGESHAPSDALTSATSRVVSISGKRTLVGRWLEDENTEHGRGSESSIEQNPEDNCPDEFAIHDEVKRILTSRSFSRAVQTSKLLGWITDRWLAGETDQLDGYHILLAIFHHVEKFEASFDATGRVYVGRLRNQLDRYYAKEGAANPIRIEIPRGKYVPIAYRYSMSETAVEIPGDRAPNTVMVLPFQLGNQSPTASAPCPLAITDHLISRLTRSPDMRVTSRVSSWGLDSGSDARLLGRQFGAQFIVEGTIIHGVDRCNLTVHLSETRDGYNIWSGHYQAKAVSLANLSKRIVRDLIRNIRRTLVTATT